MDNINNSDSEAGITIGQQIARLRVQLNMTQQQFAEAICSSRITVNKMERAEEITTDFGYRIYYATDKVVANNYIPDSIRQYAHSLKQRIESEVILAEVTKETYSPIVYTTN